jgi:TP901 family phage tail tape measure protein
MADVESNIKIGIDTGEALTQLKALQRQISAFHTSMAKTGAAGVAVSNNLSQNLANQINAGGKFYAEMKKIRTTTDAFNTALEKNQLSMREYFRYTGASTRTFGKLFKSEFDTINKVARENVKTLQTQYIKMGRDASGALKAMSVRPLTLDMNDYGTKVAMAAQRQALLNQLLRQGSTNLLNFGKNTQWAGRQLMVGFTVPLLYFGSVAAKTFMDLEEQAIRFKRVYGDIFTTNTETAKALKDVQALANEFTKYGVAVADTMKMAADVAATGKMGTDLLEQVSQANKLAVLGGIDQQKSLDTIISLTSAFGKETKALSEDINFLNAVENQTILNIDDLTTAIPKAAPVIKQLGGDVQDLAFFMTAMREGGIQAGEGANALKSGLASMINPTDKAAKSLGKMGINIKGIVEANKGDVKNLVIGMATAFDQLEPLKRAQAIEQLFGKFQFARISTLFQNVIKEGSQAQTVAKLTQATTEELAILSERELKKVEESPLYKFKKEVQDLKTAIAPVGAEFLKALTPIVKFFGNVFENFNNFGDGTKKVMVLLTAVLAGIGPLALMSFGLLANGIANIIKGFTAVKSLFNKTGSSTQHLGEQTSYLTQEQLRAASVAASLDQAHMRLTQRFTSEAAAVRNLSTAYQQAIATQSMFGLGAVRGRGGTAQQPKGYAKGVVSVPGSGTGDKVPAMLSPGEAIVPAANAKANPALVSALVSGKIKGYANGLDPLGKGYKNATVLMPESLNTLAGGKIGAPTADIVSYFKNAGSAAAAPLMGVMAKSMGMKLNDPAVKSQFAALGGQLIINATTALEKSGMQFVKDEDLERIVVPAMRKTAQAISIQGKAVGAAFESAVAEIRTIGAVGTQSGTKSGQGRTNLPGSYRGVRKDVQQFAISQRPSMFAQNERVSSSGKIKKSFQTLNPVTKQWEVATMAHITKSITATVTRLVEMTKPYLGDMGAKITKAVAKNVVDGVKKGAGIASPAKEPMIVGQQFAQGGLVGMREYVDDFNTAGKQLGAAGTAGLVSQSANALYGKSTGITATDKSIRRQQEKLGKQNQMMAGSNGGKGKVAGDAKGPRAGMIGMAASTAVMGASMMGGKVGDTAQQLMGPIMMISMLFGMMSAPLAAVVSLIGLLAFGIFKLNKAKKDEMKATLKLIDSMGTGIKPMQEFSKFAGTVTATEIMNRRRANFSSPFAIKTGKTTFGESFVASEEGKARVESIQKTISKSGKDGAISDLSNQLIGSVVSGALDYKQARSIAANIGDAIQDYDFSIAVNTKLISMLGPDGENVLKDGITIQTKLIEEQRNKLTSATQTKTSFTNGIRQVNVNYGSNESGATVFARMKNLLETQQQMLDVTEVEYSKKIEAAKIAGDLNEVNKLILERDKKRAALLDESKISYDVIQKRLEGADPSTIKAMRTAAQESITQVYKDSPMLSVLAAETGSKLNKAKISEATKLNIELGMASQDLSPQTVADLLVKFTDGKDIDKILNIMPNVGGKDADLIYGLANKFASPDKALEFIVSFQTKTTEESRKELEAFNAIRQLENIGEGIDVPILLDYAQSSGASAKISEMLEKINNTSAEDLTLDFAVNTVGQEALDELVARGQDWQMMPDDQRRDFLAASTALLNLKGDPGFIKAYKNWALQAGNAGKTINDFIGYGGYKVTEAKMADTTAAAAEKEDPNNGGGPTGSPLDDIVKKLRDVRKATQEMTMGWNDSGNALKKLAKETLGFGGLAQKLRSQGANENTIDFITGLSQEDYKKYKSMFKDFKTLQTSLNNIALGDYQNDQAKIVEQTKNQTNAFNKLVAAGMPVAHAYELIKNDAIAAAIASDKTNKSLTNIVSSKANAIAYEFKKAISLGMWDDVFSEGYNAATKYFDIQEKLIKLVKKDEINKQQLIVDNANKQIKLANNIQETNSYQISKYEDGLKTINEQADSINEKYNKQFAALDKISKINEVISRQEKSRISLAEALSQGDIYAAARAAQELRAQNAQDAIDQQRTGMEAARDAQINSLTSGGLTKDQLEEKVKILKEQNYRIEQDTIVPLREQARLAQVKLDAINEEIKLQTDSLKLAGLTKDQWEEQRIKIDAAEIATGKYNDSIQRSKDAVVELATKWDDVLRKMNQYNQNQNLSTSGSSGGKTVVKTYYEGTGKNRFKVTEYSDGTVDRVADPVSSASSSGGNSGGNTGGGPQPTQNLSSLSASQKATLSTALLKTAAQNLAFTPAKTILDNKMKPIATIPAQAPNANQLATARYSLMAAAYLVPNASSAFLTPKKKALGGMISKFASGGFAVGTDTVPAMLTPGEFIVSKYGVDKFGVDNLKAINKGNYEQSSSVYNYNLSVNVKSDANPNEIARTVMMQIKQIDSQRIKGNRI